MISPLFLALCAGALQDPEALRTRLDAAVSIVDPEARREAVDALVREGPPEIDPWLEAIARPRSLDPVATGEAMVDVELFNGEEVEKAELQLYVPESFDPATPAPLLLQLHEANGRSRGAHRQWKAVADEVGLLVVCPPDLSGHSGYGFTEAERRTGLSALRWALTHLEVDPRRVHVSGISRGGHMTWDLILRHPDRFAGAAPMIGGPRFATQKAQNNVRFLENIAALPIRDLQGANDDPALIENLRAAFAHLERLHAKDAEYLEFPGLSHNFKFDAVDWPAFFESATSRAIPDQIVLCATRAGDRHHWVEVTGVSDEVETDFGLTTRAARWNTMSEAARRRLVIEQSEEKTARVEARMNSPGRFTVKSERTTGYRLLLDRSMTRRGKPVRISVKGRSRNFESSESLSVLLHDYVERLDPGFLPVVELRIDGS